MVRLDIPTTRGMLFGMTPEQERWAEALAIERQHGADGGLFIAQRIGALALEGDEGGVERWREIAVRYDQLLAGGRRKPRS